MSGTKTNKRSFQSKQRQCAMKPVAVPRPSGHRAGESGRRVTRSRTRLESAPKGGPSRGRRTVEKLVIVRCPVQTCRSYVCEAKLPKHISKHHRKVASHTAKRGKICPTVAEPTLMKHRAKCIAMYEFVDDKSKKTQPVFLMGDRHIPPGANFNEYNFWLTGRGNEQVDLAVLPSMQHNFSRGGRGPMYPLQQVQCGMIASQQSLVICIRRSLTEDEQVQKFLVLASICTSDDEDSEDDYC